MGDDHPPTARPGEYRSFGRGAYYIPDELPPATDLEFGGEFREALENAIYQMGRLDGIGEESDTSPLVYTTMVRREAVESVLIEGAEVDIEELFRPDDFDAERIAEKDVREAINYETAIRDGASRVRDTGQIPLELLNEIHRTLLEGTRNEADHAGEFRRHAVHIPPPTASQEPFWPPPVSEIPRLMKNLERYIATGSGYHDFVDVGIAHYQLETIHPYGDGNGRLGRVLITLQLVQQGYLGKPYLYPSAYFNEHKIEYVQRMRQVSEEGAWEPWLTFFIQGIGQQAEDAVVRTGKLRALRREYEREFGHEKTATDRLAMRLLQQPYVDASTVAELLGVSGQTARNAIRELENRGILEETTGKKRYREYKAADVFEIINQPVE